ncbi:hypothetical protein OG194_20990 [Streptomyces sp. NBC_01288]|uniref:hypothetical protein n=1 Tax=Streptomyces sp. NBC_01288 TaxID=2903814 RepID=UPI002E11CB0A|nr:hypothetical protein OG194_20990 [Streptomyces sp. NBC_01288]
MTDDQLMPITRRKPLDPYSSRAPHLVGIVDTNALMSSIENDCRKGFRSRLLRMSDNGTAVLYAADHVYEEVYRRLPRMTKSSPVPLEDLYAHFEAEYLPALRFVTMSDVDAPDAQVLAITDPDDVPTGWLAKLISPCVVFSGDRDLKEPGFAPKDWQRAATSAVDVSDGHMGQLLTVNVAALPVRGVVELISFSGRKIGIPPWLLGVVVLGLGALLLKKPDRRKAATFVAGKVFEYILEELARYETQERQGIESLRKVILPAPTRPTIRQQVAITLARQNDPLLATEVHELLQEHFPDEPVVSVRDVRVALEEGTEFVRVQRYRWQLGREVGPRSS